jgi:hypothetical protein
MIAIAYRLEIMAGRVVSVPTSACRRNEPLPTPMLCMHVSSDFTRISRRYRSMDYTPMVKPILFHLSTIYIFME